MQLRNAAIALGGLCLAAVAIVWSGAQIAEPQPSFQPDQTDISDADALDVPAPVVSQNTAPEEPAPPAEQAAEPEILQPEDNFQADNPVEAPPAAPVQDSQEQAAEPPTEEPKEELERLPARPPLSELASPKSPTPPESATSGERKSTRLFKPVASSAGTIEAQGYKIALAGVEPTAADETCTFEGKEWPCGLQARTAFRSWLRGRAIACDVPSQPDQQQLLSECNIGKVDLSEWLVSNGWAKAAADGPYADAGRKASEAKKGIFGPPAATGGLNLPRISDPEPMAFPQAEPMVEEQVPEPAPVITQPPLTGQFPPAPQSPQ